MIEWIFCSSGICWRVQDACSCRAVGLKCGRASTVSAVPAFFSWSIEQVYARGTFPFPPLCAAAPLGAVVQALRGHDYQPRLAHKFVVKHSIVLRGQVARPAVMRPLPLHSGRNLPLGLRCPSHSPLGGTRWGILRTREREITKEYIITQIIAMF